LICGAFALQSLFGWEFWIGYVLVVAAQVRIAFVGYNFVARYAISSSSSIDSK
jgi:hypothetical protein